MNGLLVLIVAAMSAQLATCWDQELRDYILNIHNEQRKGEGACQMIKLEYDMDLEKQAKQWAEGCVFKHEMIKGRGENLAWNSAHDEEKTLITGSTGRWFDEKKQYSYGQKSCGSACHYTQLVWANTTKVGCYTTRCANLRYAYHDAWYLVCFYSPAGNDYGKKPYEKTCSTPCLPGQTQEDGLCVGEVTITTGGDSGNDGGDTTGTGGNTGDKDEGGPCEDKSPSCGRWAKNDQCRINPGYMLKSCKKSCNVC